MVKIKRVVPVEREGQMVLATALKARVRRQANGTFVVTLPLSVVTAQGLEAHDDVALWVARLESSNGPRRSPHARHSTARYDPGAPDSEVLEVIAAIGIKAASKAYGLSQAGMHALLERNGWRLAGTRWKPPRQRDAVVTVDNRALRVDVAQ